MRKANEQNPAGQKRTIYITTLFSSKHPAVDLAGLPVGTPVLAPEKLTVEKTGYDKNGYGYFVFARDANGNQVRFGHFNQPANWTAGQDISRGQVVGLFGSTGNSTGPHLHFEVHGPKVYGQNIDPATYLSNMGGYEALFGGLPVNVSNPGSSKNSAAAAASPVIVPGAGLSGTKSSGSVSRAAAAAPVIPVNNLDQMVLPDNGQYNAFSSGVFPSQITINASPEAGKLTGQIIADHASGTAGTSSSSSASSSSPAGLLSSISGVADVLSGKKSTAGSAVITNTVFIMLGVVLILAGIIVLVYSVDRGVKSGERKVLLSAADFGEKVPGEVGAVSRTIKSASRKVDEIAK